jgi:hypothetical protein
VLLRTSAVLPGRAGSNLDCTQNAAGSRTRGGCVQLLGNVQHVAKPFPGSLHVTVEVLDDAQIRERLGVSFTRGTA